MSIAKCPSEEKRMLAGSAWLVSLAENVTCPQGPDPSGLLRCSIADSYVCGITLG